MGKKSNKLQTKPPHSALFDSSSEHLKYIGLVSANWALLESQMCTLFAHMSGMDYPGARAILYSVSSNKIRREIIEHYAVSQNFSGSSLKELKALLSKIKRIADKRNRFSHDVYSVGAEGRVFQKQPSARKNTDIKTAVTVADLERLAEEIALTSTRLIKLIPVIGSQASAQKKKN